ncbi:GPI inositol-deacylase [Condylostylus longicornis]|uniref:GPI inositol-deacylase n=1 Tax=Condylostylus longicornis TaxID=2530218 RepID=UPI00244DBC24|nr:GPI inositol-deacylase [Condylostylus longicornis]
MFRIIIVIISIFCALFLLYGLLFAVLENEPNRCRMTYMFEYPQFVRIHFPANKFYERYGLYAYSEGALTERTRSMDFTGAPVIFIPGNSGSYKQARSLASVAIRKGLDNGWYQHLDYFSIDFNEEYNGIFGGYLENERDFVKASIFAVLNLYSKLSNKPTQVTLIGHSMGGKIAQSLLAHDDVSPLINTIITIATPIDEPVLNIDYYFAHFYKNINKYFETNRSFQITNNETNHCTGIFATKNLKNESLSLDDKLIISIGGGSRDFMIHSGLTSSKFSDLNTLTTAIPNVWVTTDHLCSVWCLQFVLVINRFLHSIITPYSANRKYERFAQQFTQDKSIRLAKAKHFLLKPDYGHRMREIDLPPARIGVIEWEEDSRRVFSKSYNDGLNKTVIQMIRLTDSPHHKYLSVVAVNIEYDENFLMGCAAIDFNEGMRYCKKALSLSKYITRIPTIGDNKVIIKLDLHKLKDTYPSWTHIILRFNPTRKRFSCSIDIFDPDLRFVKIHAPKWNSYSQYDVLEETLYGSSFYKFEISGIEDSHQSLYFNIKPKICSQNKHHAVARVCIPWLKNCDKYQHFTDEENRPLYIDVPKTKPQNYNSTANPIIVQLHLDANCRYKISYKNSFGGTMSRILQQYFHWLPAHLVGILLMAFRHQITITPKKLSFRCGKLQTGLLVCSSFFIITMSRLFGKLFQMLSFLPELDPYSESLMVSILIHGTAFAMLISVTIFLWLTIKIYGNMAHKILLRIIKLPIKLPTITDAVMPVIEKIPISSGIILVFVASGSCGGVAMIIGCVIYFMQILKDYEDYLEEFVYDTAKMIAEKLFGKVKEKFFKKKSDIENAESKENESETDVTDIEELNSDTSIALSDKEEGKEEEVKIIKNISSEDPEHSEKNQDKNIRRRKRKMKTDIDESREVKNQIDSEDSLKNSKDLTKNLENKKDSVKSEEYETYSIKNQESEKVSDDLEKETKPISKLQDQEEKNDSISIKPETISKDLKKDQANEENPKKLPSENLEKDDKNKKSDELKIKKREDSKNKEEESKNLNDDKDMATNHKNENEIDTKQLSESSEILLNAYDAASEQDFPEDISETELNKLLDEAITRQKQILDEKKKKESLERLEYDSVHESFSSINFHMTLLILLGILTLINLPATVSWAKNYTYDRRLSPDPSYIPSLIVLLSISILRQFGAPRNVYGYTILSGILYAIAGGCILYCQDSIYRLNYIIPAIFLLITIQQLFLPKKPEENQEEEADKELKNKIERMKNLLEECEGDLESAD